MRHSTKSTDIIDQQLRPINTIPCDVFFEGEFYTSFISVVTPFADPRIAALFASWKGTFYSDECYIIPITPNLHYSITYPILTISDGPRTFYFRFQTFSSITELFKIVNTRVREFFKTHLTVESCYSTFFADPHSSQIASQVPKIDTASIFKSLFRISKDEVFEDPTAIAMLLQNEKWFRSYTDLSVYVATWNIDQKHPPTAEIKNLFGGGTKQYDILVFNFQEIDMSAECIMRGASPARKQAWDKAILDALNSVASYTFIGGHQLGTAYISAFIRSQAAPRIKNVATSEVVLGSMGFYNKTAVGLRFGLDDSQICFICSHLSHGRKNFERRNSEFWKIQSEMVFTTESGTLHVEDHDAVIWSGDFNYRLILPDTEARQRFNETEFLYQNDQLYIAHKSNKVFVGYEEGKVSFSPTYKFDPGTSTIDSSSKQRGPAWCDRIFLRMTTASSFVSLKEYNSIPTLMMSDHRPVYSIFEFRPWTTDAAKAQALYREVRAKISALPWNVKICTDNLDFGDVKFGEQKTLTLVLKNEGQVPAIFDIRPKEAWLTAHPNRGTVLPDQSFDVYVSVLINEETQKVNPLTTHEFMAPLTVYFASEKPPYFLTVSGRYLMSPVGMPIEYLLRLPLALADTPPSLFLPEKPDDHKSARIISLPQQKEVPYEMVTLIDELRKIGNDTNLFLKLGESSEILEVFEYLRVRKPFDRHFSQQTIAGALLSLLEDLYEPLIPVDRLKVFDSKQADIKEFMSSLRRETQDLMRYLIMYLRYLFETLMKNVQDRKPIYTVIGLALVQARKTNAKGLPDQCARLMEQLIMSWI